MIDIMAYFIFTVVPVLSFISIYLLLKLLTDENRKTKTKTSHRVIISLGFTLNIWIVCLLLLFKL